MLLYGYARVSTHGQTLEAQIEQLAGAGCRTVYREKVSGARADRRQLKRLLKALSPGDAVVVKRARRMAARIWLSMSPAGCNSFNALSSNPASTTAGLKHSLSTRSSVTLPNCIAMNAVRLTTRLCLSSS